MKAIITIAMLISALFATTKEKNILKYGIYADASRCIAIETVDQDTERVSVQTSGGMVYAFDTDTGDYETGDDITLIFCDMGTQDVHDDMIISARYDRYDLLPSELYDYIASVPSQLHAAAVELVKFELS